MIRDAQIPFPLPLLLQCRIYADLHGLDCAETVIQQAVVDVLATDPRCAELAELEQKAKRDARKAYLALHKTP